MQIHGKAIILISWLIIIDSFRLPLYQKSQFQNNVALFSQKEQDFSSIILDRRNALGKSLLLSSSYFLLSSNVASAATTTTTTSSSSTSSSSSQENSKSSITHQVFFDIRISRADGTFYVRDDLSPTFENTVFYKRLTFGLYGNVAPNHVAKFLEFVTAKYNPLDEAPQPSYSRSLITSYDDATGLIDFGIIPGLIVTDFNGAAALQYKGRLIPASLWIDSQDKISHNSSLLLTHKALDLTPNFSITTRDDTNLDSNRVVFGCVIPDESSKEFFDIVKRIPTYSLSRPATGNSAKDDIAGAVFRAEKDLFRGLAGSLGDTRVDNIYEGKFLRRIEVTQVGVLEPR